jgi:hypothetical protein
MLTSLTRNMQIKSADMTKGHQMKISMNEFHGKYITASLKFDENRGFNSVAGVLDASNFPTLKVNDKEFQEEEISSVTIGNPADYPYREL